VADGPLVRFGGTWWRWHVLLDRLGEPLTGHWPVRLSAGGCDALAAT
jgi:hypothetical protein